ncbi:efflux transporter outer membrane subunit [Thalassospira marina]|uniref:RND transporter n=1 Tax=Thalassospira marina TaxID=2048283 RepID=A0ABN5FUM3_9PROT|nr:efflux transporter outer membrane subunit [Thalassospira marina]AUG55540.1 RND transporter [Thalassospira marina]
MLKSTLKTGTILTLLLLAGCSSLEKATYNQPDVTLPAGWRSDSTVTGTTATNPASRSTPATKTGTTPQSSGTANNAGVAMAPSNWWHNFNDPALDQLVANALAQNNDLAAATIKVRQAQLQAGIAKTDLFPDLSAGANSSTSRNLDTGRISRSYGTTSSVSYEVDLWGKLGSNYDAKKWEALATEKDRASTALTLTGTTANLYWQSVYDQQRLAIAQASIDYARKTLELVNVQYQSGASSSLELYESRRSLESQLADYTQIAQSLKANKNALSILFDQPPQEIAISRDTLPDGTLPAVKSGLPADLLARRPDVKAAELRLRADIANINTAKTSLLPTLNLTGELGTSSDQLRNLLENPIGTLGASIALPFLNWNERQLDIRVSEAQYEQDVINYRQTLYQAFSDVETALSARDHYIAQAQNLRAALNDARNAERIYETRFRAGAVSMQSWLDAQENRRTAEESLLQNQLNQILNLVTLYQALGGDSET